MFGREFQLTVTELGITAYWIFAGLMAAELLNIPAEYMYTDHLNPTVIAWNWSFFPIDIAFAICGLTARFGGIRPSLRHGLEIIAATLMLAAGIMAISFWAIRGEFDPWWWGPNFWLIGLAVWSLVVKIRAASQTPPR